MSSWQITIMGQKWKYRLLTEEKYIRLHSDDSCAITLPPKKVMAFRQGHVCLGVVRHEVRHAFTHELCLESAELTASQMEEIQCTLDETRWELMDQIARKIFGNLSKKKPTAKSGQQP